jgi:AraC family transcriptional regulator
MKPPRPVTPPAATAPVTSTVVDVLADTPAYTVRIVRYPPRWLMPTHAHDTSGVSLNLAGGLVEEVGTVRVDAGIGDLVLKPSGTRHADAFGPAGATLLGVTLKDEREAGGDPPLRSWRWTRDAALARAVLRLAASGAAHDRHRAGGDALRDCAHDCVAELIAATQRVDRRERGPIPSWLRRVKEALEAHPTTGVPVSALAREAGVHPVYLARRFRLAFGCSIVEYRQALRVLAVAHEITTSMTASSRASLQRFAFRTGFADQSHMGRVFRAQLGASPLRFSQLLGGSASRG